VRWGGGHLFLTKPQPLTHNQLLLRSNPNPNADPSPNPGPTPTPTPNPHTLHLTLARWGPHSCFYSPGSARVLSSNSTACRRASSCPRWAPTSPTRRASVQVCKYASVQVCKCASVQVCKCASVHVCKCASVQCTGEVSTLAYARQQRASHAYICMYSTYAYVGTRASSVPAMWLVIYTYAFS